MVKLKANKIFVKELRKKNPKNIDQIKKICENSKSKD